MKSFAVLVFLQDDGTTVINHYVSNETAISGLYHIYIDIHVKKYPGCQKFLYSPPGCYPFCFTASGREPLVTCEMNSTSFVTKFVPRRWLVSYNYQSQKRCVRSSSVTKCTLDFSQIIFKIPLLFPYHEIQSTLFFLPTFCRVFGQDFCRFFVKQLTLFQIPTRQSWRLK